MGSLKPASNQLYNKIRIYMWTDASDLRHIHKRNVFPKLMVMPTDLSPFTLHSQLLLRCYWSLGDSGSQVGILKRGF